MVGPHAPHLRALQQHLADEVCDDENNIEPSSANKGPASKTKRNSEQNGHRQKRRAPLDSVYGKQDNEKKSSTGDATVKPQSNSPLDSSRASMLWPVLQEYCNIITDKVI